MKIFQKLTVEKPKVHVTLRHPLENANRSLTLPRRNPEALYTSVLKNLVLIKQNGVITAEE